MVIAGRYVTVGQVVYWDGRTANGEIVSSDTYFYQLQTDDYSQTRKLIIPTPFLCWRWNRGNRHQF